MMIIVFLELLSVGISARFGSDTEAGADGGGGGGVFGVGAETGPTVGFTSCPSGVCGAETGGILGLAGVSIFMINFSAI